MDRSIDRHYVIYIEAKRHLPPSKSRIEDTCSHRSNVRSIKLAWIKGTVITHTAHFTNFNTVTIETAHRTMDLQTCVNLTDYLFASRLLKKKRHSNNFSGDWMWCLNLYQIDCRDRIFLMFKCFLLPDINIIHKHFQIFTRLEAWPNIWDKCISKTKGQVFHDIL